MSVAVGSGRPVFVDLDGTLVSTDTLHEGLIALLRRAPWKLPALVLGLLKGRAAFKRIVVESKGLPDVASLPYREAVLNFLRTARDEGRPPAEPRSRRRPSRPSSSRA